MENESREKKETDDSSMNRHRKGGLKFSPKVPPKKDPNITPKMEPNEENKNVTIDKEIMMRVRSSQRPKSRLHLDEQTLQPQELFPLQDSLYSGISLSLGTSLGFMLSCVHVFTNQFKVFCEAAKKGCTCVSAVKLPEEHDEPWDYNSNYPVTLPLRRPYSGDPAMLDEEQSRQSSSSRAQAGELTAAEELGLMETVDKAQLLFFQFPTSLPLQRHADPTAETDTDTNVNVNAKSKVNNRKRHHSIQGCNLKTLPGGLMGKIRVFRSGKVKMMLGDALFDVSAGSNCSFAQEVVAIDTREKHCCGIGELGKRAVVTPDIDSLLDY